MCGGGGGGGGCWEANVSWRGKVEYDSTVLNLILRMEKIISILKNVRFSGKGHQSLHM